MAKCFKKIIVSKLENEPTSNRNKAQKSNPHYRNMVLEPTLPQTKFFITQLKARRTNPSIINAIQQHLTNWCNLKEELPNGAQPSWYTVTEQNAIGWRQFFCRKLSTKWIDLQQKYWK